MSAAPVRLSEIDPNTDEPQPECPKIGYIDDDLVISGECPETETTPAVRFTYHPLSAGEYTEYLNKLDAARGKSLKERERVVLTDLIQRHLKTWDLRKRDGTPVNFKDIKELQRVPLKIIDWIGNQITETSRSIDAALLGK